MKNTKTKTENSIFGNHEKGKNAVTESILMALLK